ncbi:MAG: hypothetical protein WCD31_03460, partial [Gillisia sp.]
MKNREKHLYYLEELKDYEVDSHYEDVRGWPVKDRDNRVIGKVDNLLVNKDLERVVYLDVEVDDTIIEANHDPYGRPANQDIKEFVNKEGENHVIIPIGMIDINTDNNFVYTESIDHQTFAETKRIKTGADIDRDYEVIVLDSYTRDRNSADHFSKTDYNSNEDYKESAYRADRERTENADHTVTYEEMERQDEEYSNERKNLVEERRRLRHERLKLEEERKKLEAERKKHSPTPGRDDEDDRQRRKNATGDPFYDR